MKAKEFMTQISESIDENWQNSDLWRETELNLETILTHFEKCEECREGFDAMTYKEKTLLDLENHIGFDELSGWICEEAA